MRAVLIPVKRFSRANERLREVLSPSAREGLARVMLGDVLSNIRLCGKADALFVVTAEPEAMETGRAMGMEIIAEETQEGESSSVYFAMKKCAEMGARSVLVVPGDIPCAPPGEFDAVMEKDDGEKRIVIVPSRDGTGTNALMMNPCGVMKPSFGNNSFPRHKEMARAAGIAFSSLTLSGIGLDIDGPEDLEIFMRAGAGTETHNYLRNLGVETKTGKTA